MKLTVCFGEVRVVVPCGDGDFAVHELMQRAVDRYKKATRKLSECDVRVYVLKNQRDGGILDPDDLLVDVVDDREQVFAEFEELPSGLRIPACGGSEVMRMKLHELVPDRDGSSRLEVAVTNQGEIRNGGRFQSESRSSESSDSDEGEEQPVSFVVVTENDFDAGVKRSQLTVRRESEPCHAAVSTAVNLMPSLEPLSSQQKPLRACIPEVPESASGVLPLSPTDSVRSSDRKKSDGDTSDDDDDTDRSDSPPPRDSGSELLGAELVPPGDAAKPAAVTRLLNGFVRCQARQSLGSRNGPDWTAAQQRAELRSAVLNPAPAVAHRGPLVQKRTQSPLASPAAAMSLAQPPETATSTESSGCSPNGSRNSNELVMAERPVVIGECAPERLTQQNQLHSRQQGQQQLTVTSSGLPHASNATCATEPASIGSDDDEHLCDAGDPSQNLSATAAQNGSHVVVKISSSTEPLGLHVAGYFQNGREAGLAVHHLESGGRIEREGQIAIGDIIQQVNGRSLLGVPLDKAKAILRDALNSGKAALTVAKCRANDAASAAATSSSSSSSSAPSASPSPPKSSDTISLTDRRGSDTAVKQPPLPPVRSPSTRLSSEAPERAAAAAAERLIGPPRPIGFDEVTVDLVKGPEGLGFTISSREHLAVFNEGVPPVYVKTIMPFGAAVADGRIKCGDRLMNVNGMDVSLKTQDDIVSLLRSTKQGSVVSIRVLRPQLLLDVPSQPQTVTSSTLGSSPGSPADPTYENVLVKAADPFVEYGDIMTFDIPTTAIVPGTLGISIKGETAMTAEGVYDLGVFVKDVVPGGAAFLDGRILPGDLLVCVNGTSLQGLSNAAAMSVFRRAAGEKRNACNVTVSRRLRRPAGDEAEERVAALAAPAQSSSCVTAGSAMATETAAKVPDTSLCLGTDDGGSSHQSGIDTTEIKSVAPIGTTSVSSGPGELLAVAAGVATSRRPAPGLVYGQTPPALAPAPLSFASLASHSSLFQTSGSSRPTTLSLAARYPSHPSPAQNPSPPAGASSKLSLDHRGAEAAVAVSVVTPTAAGRPTPVPRKTSTSAAQSKPHCDVSTSPLRSSADDDDCSPSSVSRLYGRIGHGGGGTAADSQDERSLPATLPGLLPSLPVISSLRLPDGGRRPTEERMSPREHGDDEPRDTVLPAAYGFLNDSAVADATDAAAAAATGGASESSANSSPSQVEKVDAAIQCEAAAVTSTGSLGGRGKWEQRFHRDRSGGVGSSSALRRSTPRSQVSDAEKKERRKSELIQSSPYPGLVTTLAAAASTATAASSPASFSSPLYEDPDVVRLASVRSVDAGKRSNGDRTEGPNEAPSLVPPATGGQDCGSDGSPGESTVRKLADVLAAEEIALPGNSELQQRSERRRQSPDARGRTNDSREPLPDARGRMHSSSVYSSVSPVSQWVEHTLEHSRAQPSTRLLVSGSRPTPSHSPLHGKAASALAAASLDPPGDWLSWDDDNDGVPLGIEQLGRKSPRKDRLLHQQECRRPAAPRPTKPLVRRRAQSVESLDSDGSSIEALQPQTTRTRSRFSSLDSLKAELRDAYDDQPPPCSRARRRVTRGCNESFRAAVDHSYDASELPRALPPSSAIMATAHGCKFDEVHDSGINPLSSSSSASSDNYAEIDKKSPTAMPAKDNGKGLKKDKAKASSFFGHLFRLGKNRKEDRPKEPATKVISGRGSDWIDGRPQLPSRAGTTAVVQPRLQRNEQQGSWSYHSNVKVGAATAVTPSMMNEYYRRLMEEQRLQMVLASAISNEATSTAAAREHEHVYVNVTLPSSRGSLRANGKGAPQLDAVAAVARLPPTESAEPLYAKMKTMQKSEPNLSKHRAAPSAAEPWGRDRGLWSDRIYRLSEKDLTSDSREASSAKDRRNQSTEHSTTGAGKRKNTMATTSTTTSSMSARRPLSLYDDDSDTLLIAAHRRATASNDYDDLPSGGSGTSAVLPNTAAQRMRPDGSWAAAQPRPAVSAAVARPSAAAGAARSHAVSRTSGGNGRQSHRLSLCYDYSDSSSDDYSYGDQVTAASHAYAGAGSRGSRRATELARV